MSKKEMKQFYLEREAHNLTIDKYQFFAGEVRNYLGDLIAMAEISGLAEGSTIMNLKGLYDLANENFDEDAFQREITRESESRVLKNKHDELPKEVCELLEQLIGDIDSGAIDPCEIKGKLENIQTLSEVYYEYQLGKDDE